MVFYVVTWLFIFIPRKSFTPALEKIFPVSFLHRGQGPVFLAPAVVTYLLGGISSVQPCIDDVPDDLLQSKLKRVLM